MERLAIDEPLVRSLLRDQHPGLSELSLRRVPGGWDNELWRLGDALAVRLPRTQRAPALLRKEYRWLPVLATRLPLPVPVPVRTGAPSARFPHPWNVATWVPGEPGDHAEIGRAHESADALADFLRALHRLAPVDAPAGANRGVPLATLTHEFEERIRTVASSSFADAVRAVWDEAVAAPEWRGAPVWIHGDLHPANVVVSEGMLSGVIDFGELCAGDPATDLAAAWLLLPGDAGRRFLDAYADADEAMVRRARGWAALRAVSLIGIGQAWERGLPGGQPTWGRVGRAALDRVSRARCLPRSAGRAGTRSAMPSGSPSVDQGDGTTESGVKGSPAQAHAQGAQRTGTCSGEDRSITFGFENSKGDFVAPAFHGRTGVPGAVGDEPATKTRQPSEGASAPARAVRVVGGAGDAVELLGDPGLLGRIAGR